MSINLQKGQRIDLTKTNPGLKKVVIGFGDGTNDGSISEMKNTIREKYL